MMFNHFAKIRDTTQSIYAQLHLKDEQYKQLTILASFYLIVNNDVQLCSIGTGTKSVGVNLLKSSMYRLHSCHAEVIAKRGFQVWMYDQLSDPKKTEEYFEKSSNGKLKLKSDIQVCLYISQPPCGECSLFKNSKIYGLSAARPFSEFDKPSLDTIFGENRLRSTPTNSKTPTHQRSPSFCCSDKIMLWNVLGVQGALLQQFLDPIYIDNIIIEYREHESLTVGLDIVKRSGKHKQEFLQINNKTISKKFRVNKAKVWYSRKRLFKDSAFNPLNDNVNKRYHNDKITEMDKCFQAYSYIYITNDKSEKINSITGLKWGIAKKDEGKVKLLPFISKPLLFQRYLNLCQMNHFNQCLPKSRQLLNSHPSYQQCKQANVRYTAIKQQIRKGFTEWTPDKSYLDDFKLPIELGLYVNN